jgi:hypothetical protein
MTLETMPAIVPNFDDVGVPEVPEFLDQIVASATCGRAGCQPT